MTQEFKEGEIATIGIEYMNKTIEVHGKKVQLEIWDTAGQERFHSIAPIYYRKANAVLLVYDITSKSTFDRAKLWLQELESNGNPNALTVLLGNKTDLESKREVNLNVQTTILLLILNRKLLTLRKRTSLKGMMLLQRIHK
jgi:small GTP-binding protein